MSKSNLFTLSAPDGAFCGFSAEECATLRSWLDDGGFSADYLAGGGFHARVGSVARIQLTAPSDDGPGGSGPKSPLSAGITGNQIKPKGGNNNDDPLL